MENLFLNNINSNVRNVCKSNLQIIKKWINNYKWNLFLGYSKVKLHHWYNIGFRIVLQVNLDFKKKPLFKVNVFMEYYHS